MDTPNHNQTIIDRLNAISELGTYIELSAEEADFMELETWDSEEILDDGGEDG